MSVFDELEIRLSESTFLPTGVLIEMLFTLKCWYGAYLQMLKVSNQHFRFVDVVPITSV